MSYKILKPEPKKIKTPRRVKLASEMNALVYHGPGSNDIPDGKINSETISELGLKLSDKKINAVISPHARVFEYPYMDNVFIMENDLYGNVMHKDFCFLAFSGHHGLIGKDLSVETLKNSSVADIRKMVECNMEG